MRRLLTLLLLGACARPFTQVVPAPAIPRPAPQPRPEGRARVIHPAREDHHAWWIDEHGAPRRVLYGGRRVELEGAVGRQSDGWFSQPMRAVWRERDHWVFAGRTARWEADEFLGPLRSVATTSVGALGLGTGRAVVIRDGAAEGVGLPPGVVLDAAFSDATEGLAILEPGVVLHTEDGGLHWSPTMLDDVPLEVAAADGRRWVRAGAGCYEANVGGPMTRVECERTPFLMRPLSEDEALAVEEWSAAREGWEPLLFVDASHRRVLADVGRSQQQSSAPMALIYDLDDDAVVPGSEREMPCDPDSFEDSFTADRAYVRCRGDGESVLWSLEPDGRWSERLRVSRCGGERACAASADGERVACEGSCGGGRTTCATGTALCERVRGGTPRTWVEGTPVRGWSLAGYDGDAPVLVDRRMWLDHAEYRRGSAAPARLVPDAAWADCRIDGAPRLGSDGVMRLHAVCLGGSVVLEGRPGASFTARSTPPWMAPQRDVVPTALCGADGVVVAAHDGVRWLSLGAVDPWRRMVPESLSGALDMRPADADDPNQRALCNAAGWIYPFHGAVFGWGEVEASRHGAALAAPLPRADRSLSRWRCSTDTPIAGPRPPPGFLPIRWSVLSPWFRWGRGVFELWDDVGSAPVVRRYRVATDTQQLFASGAWDLLRADGRAATMLLWEPAPWRGRVQARLVTLSTSAFPRVEAPLSGWEFEPSPGTWHASECPSATTVGAREGSVTAWLSLPLTARRDDEMLASGAGLLTFAGGRLTAHRVSIDARSPPPGVFVLDGRWGVARRRRDGTVVGGAPGESPRRLAGSVGATACGAGARGAFTFPAIREEASGAIADAAEEYALDGDALCLRVLRSGWFAAVPTTDGVADAAMNVRCRR